LAARLRVWILTVGEALPIGEEQERLMRSGLLANLLASRNVQVVWWTGNFRHVQKTKLFSESTAVEISVNLKVWCIDSRPYYKNVSIRRILANRDLATEFSRLARLEPRPDIVVASYPVPELAEAGARYARDHGIPSIIDIRDLWPEIWADVLPAVLRPPTKAFLKRYGGARRILRQFTSICGITDQIVEWGLLQAGRDPNWCDKAFPHGYPERSHSSSDLAKAMLFWNARLPTPRPRLCLCFFGSMTPRTRVDILVTAMRHLPEEIRRHTQLVLCGTGPTFDQLRQSATDLPEIVFPGWISGPQIAALAAMSDAGLLPYPSEGDFRLSIPNKAIEYLAFGLPIISSLSGPVSNLIKDHQCGIHYAETDAKDLARVIVNLHGDGADLKTMSSNARRLFGDEFTAEAVYGKMADLILQLASLQGRRHP
jgi:glycosyltransferase involved in cell wall biosynthesis